MSTGLSKWSEILKFLITKKKKKVSIPMYSEYPTKTKNVGLNVIKELQMNLFYYIGLSDHTGEIYAPIAGCQWYWFFRATFYF